VLTSAESFGSVKDSLSEAGLETEQAEVTMRPANNISISLDEAKQMLRLLDMLDDADDVQQVYSNADIADDILAELQ
jgi:transcriptional/translational regulatory protein YebC/TACO1